MTETLSTAEPKAFVAVAVNVFAPSTSGTLALKLPAVTVADTPLTSTVTGSVPETVPVTAAGVTPVSVPSAGAWMATVGASPRSTSTES